MKKLISIIIILFFISVPLILRGKSAKEEAASAERGKYLARRGIIIPPEEVYIDSYISYINYYYPEPEAEFGVTLYSGHRQVSSGGQEEVIQIGIQGGELRFEDLPPMNLAFVIDKSGSMQERDKMDWVKESFYIFIEKVRDKDFVSLIVFDNYARVIFPSTRMNSVDKREKFKRAVRGIQPGGGTNLVEGLQLGYKEVLSNYRKEYTNRVLFLTDGMGESKGLLEMAETYKGMGINVSTIGVGESFDLQLMRDLGEKGEGSSRFISDREEMEKTFGSELDRMVVPIANDLNMKLEFLQDVKILGTWGYNYRIEGDRIHYYLPTLHHRDYETILVQVRISPQKLTGEKNLARFSFTYSDVDGNNRHGGPYFLKTNFVDIDSPVAGFSDGMVLQSGTMLHFAQALKEIGRLYYSGQVERSLQESLENLFREMTLDLRTRGMGTIAVSGFTTREGKTSDLIILLNEMALFEIAGLGNMKVIEREKMDTILSEQKLALSDLMDTSNAVEIGKLLTANHILTGSVIEMPGSVVIFGRIINVETAEIESVAQVIVPKNRDVRALL